MNDDVYTQWLKVWEDAIRVSGVSGLSTYELTKRWGVSDKTVRKRLRWLDEAGFLANGRAMRETIADGWVTVPVYYAVTGGVTGLVDVTGMGQ